MVEWREVKILEQMVPPAKENKSIFFFFLPNPPLPITDMNKQQQQKMFFILPLEVGHI